MIYKLTLNERLDDDRYCNGCTQLQRDVYERYKLEYSCPHQFHDYLEREGGNIIRAEDCPLQITNNKEI